MRGRRRGERVWTIVTERRHERDTTEETSEKGDRERERKEGERKRARPNRPRGWRREYGQGSRNEVTEFADSCPAL